MNTKIVTTPTLTLNNLYELHQAYEAGLMPADVAASTNLPAIVVEKQFALWAAEESEGYHIYLPTPSTTIAPDPTAEPAPTTDEILGAVYGLAGLAVVSTGLYGCYLFATITLPALATAAATAGAAAMAQVATLAVYVVAAGVLVFALQCITIAPKKPEAMEEKTEKPTQNIIINNITNIN